MYCFPFHKRFWLSIGLCLFLLSPNVYAITTGSAFSGPVNADGVSIYWNAAALGQKSDLAFNFELNTIYADASYLRAGTDPNTGKAYEEVSFALPAPDFTFSIDGPTPLHSLRWVFGGFSPYAIGGLWPDDGPQRFFAKKALIFTYKLAAGVIYRPLKNLSLSVLGGATYGQLEQNNTIDFAAFANNLLPPGADIFSTENPMLEGSMHLEAKGVSPSASIGFWWEPLRQLRKTFIFLIYFALFALRVPFGCRSRRALHFQNKQKSIDFIMFLTPSLDPSWATERNAQKKSWPIAAPKGCQEKRPIPLCLNTLNL